MRLSGPHWVAEWSYCRAGLRVITWASACHYTITVVLMWVRINHNNCTCVRAQVQAVIAILHFATVRRKATSCEAAWPSSGFHRTENPRFSKFSLARDVYVSTARQVELHFYCEGHRGLGSFRWILKHASLSLRKSLTMSFLLNHNLK